MKRFTSEERNKLIKNLSKDTLENSILKTPLADFIPVNEDDKDEVSKFAQNILSLCNQATTVPHNVVVASLALALFSACSSFRNVTPNHSKLIH